jgi:hypothetical protein
MSKQRFDPELASEMEWPECVLAASLKTNVTDDERSTTWMCVDCEKELVLWNQFLLADTAQQFLDQGWRYRRTQTGMDAICIDCRSHK